MGLMGRAIAERLIAAGHAVAVYNRTRDKAEPVLDLGASWADTPAELGAGCDITFTMVSDPAAVQAVSLGPDGVLAGITPEAVHCDLGTVGPSWARTMDATYRDRGRRFVQAPVLGSRRQ